MIGRGWREFNDEYLSTIYEAILAGLGIALRKNNSTAIITETRRPDDKHPVMIFNF